MSPARRRFATLETQVEPTPSPRAARRRRLLPALDLAGILLLGFALALSVRGHYPRPHEDFFELLETGQALLGGELPSTFKRAPLYPLIVAAGGALLDAAVPGGTPAAQRFGEWLSALLLPANAVLLYFVARRWTAGAARWAALVFLLLPWGLYCTAHLLLEPLLVAMILLTLLAAGRRPALACLFASAATLTRFDAAGLIAGLILSDVLRRERPARIALRGLAMAALPALWLLLTALTWSERSGDHYVRQMIERPGFDLVWSARAVLDACVNPQRLVLPPWADLEPAILRELAGGVLVLSGLVGAAVMLARREPAAVAGVVAFAAYALVHAAFPFRFERFGYPPAPLLLAFSAAGLSSAWSVASRSAWERGVRAGVTTFAVVAATLLIWGETSARTAGGGGLRSTALLPIFAIALALPTVAAMLGGTRRVAQGLAALLVAAAGLVHLREGEALLGPRAARDELLDAARWVAARLRPDDGVVSDVSGLLRLYAPGHDRARLISFERLGGETLAEALAECRKRGVRYLIWHERIFDFHGAYYAARWRLERFTPLSEPRLVPGLRVAWQGDGVWVLQPEE